jgi:nucleotide-binding universal stress UspA family protein
MAQGPVFDGLTAVLAFAGADTPVVRSQLEAAQTRLAAGGLHVTIAVEAGEPKVALQHKIVAKGFDLLVMGAYGHSRIRNLIIGSTTTALIRTCKVPVLLDR